MGTKGARLLASFAYGIVSFASLVHSQLHLPTFFSAIGWAEIEIKAKLSPAEAGVCAELGNIAQSKLGINSY